MKGDKKIRKPKQGEKHEAVTTSLLRIHQPPGSSWRLFLLEDIKQADDHDLAWLVVGIVELGIVQDVSQVTAMERRFRRRRCRLWREAPDCQRSFLGMQSSFESLRVAESGFIDDKQSKKIRQRKALAASLFSM